MSKLERKTILVTSGTVPALATSFNFNIFLNFQPDEVIVRQYSYFGNATANHVFSITSSLVDNVALFSCNDSNVTIALNTHFPITQPVRGTFTFNCLDIDNLNVGLPLQLSFMLEFVKYNKNLLQ